MIFLLQQFAPPFFFSFSFSLSLISSKKIEQFSSGLMNFLVKSCRFRWEILQFDSSEVKGSPKNHCLASHVQRPLAYTNRRIFLLFLLSQKSNIWRTLRFFLSWLDRLWKTLQRNWFSFSQKNFSWIALCGVWMWILVDQETIFCNFF